MPEIENTSSEDAMKFFMLDSLFGEVGGAVERQEARGQAQLIKSEQLPTDTGGKDAEFEALGFTFGLASECDPIFRPATLPQGWKKKPSDHSMWSTIVDELGRERVGIFYKAAFYDRRAFMRLTGVHEYVSRCLSASVAPIPDETWATREVLAEALREIEKQERVNSTDPYFNKAGQQEALKEAERARQAREALLKG